VSKQRRIRRVKNTKGTEALLYGSNEAALEVNVQGTMNMFKTGTGE
jgi:hypothetical protein